MNEQYSVYNPFENTIVETYIGEGTKEKALNCAFEMANIRNQSYIVIGMSIKIKAAHFVEIVEPAD